MRARVSRERKKPAARRRSKSGMRWGSLGESETRRLDANYPNIINIMWPNQTRPKNDVG
jgi:hypothetical protein